MKSSQSSDARSNIYVSITVGVKIYEIKIKGRRINYSGCRIHAK
jgi:hypothetical protein